MNVSLLGPGPIGLDIGSELVKAAQIMQGARGTPLVRTAAFPRATQGPLDEPEALRIVGILRRMGFVGERAVIAAPAQAVMASVLELPPKSSGVPIKSLARSELARIHKADPASFEMASWELPGHQRGGGMTHLAAFALPTAAAETVLAPLDAAGLEVQAIDLPSAAVMRACEAAAPSAPGRVGVVADLGASAAVVMLRLNGVTVYERRVVELGLCALTREVAARGSLKPDAAALLIRRVGDTPVTERRAGNTGPAVVGGMVASWAGRVGAEVSVSVAYASRRYQSQGVETLLLCGGGAGLTGVPEAVGSAASIPAKAVDLSAALRMVGASASASLACGAIGLALHGRTIGKRRTA